ncbi:general transcription factor 3C polypeptide 1 [Oncorhynchus mykiss]|uniref:general transcription factor 3C polypeptide 1 n=1 Tax=Oncorhynchus mykiss TaxID=8022 RepID=UPI001877D0B1|nr:general transcription factor 3C polypeptide 1 [Oncorhynchus mykiss]
MDPLDIVMDEVALEGLDGVTILSLWIRLEKRNPAFPRNLDPCTKEFIWKSLVSNHEVDFYELPQERADVVLVDRFADIDPDTGIQEASHWDRVDSYPVQILLEDKSGIQGSCVFFNERRNVTPIIRTTNLTPCVTVEDAFKRWGRKLVMVASQRLRFRVLIGDGGDPDLKLTDHSYCILERVGRARWQGELQRDLHSCSFKTDPRKMHYLRKSLTQNDLITMQSHVLRLASGAQQHSILLLLKRFHVDRRSKYDILMELTSNLLSEAPNHTASMITLRDQLSISERTFKRMYQYMQAAKLVQVVIKPVEHLNPTVGPCDTRRGTKVVARCLKLIKPYVRKEVVEAEDDDDNDDDDGGGANRKTVPTEGRIMERDFLSQAYGIIVSCGTKGISQSALRARMCIGKLESRMICRLLERTDMIKGFMEDEGRQRTTKYLGHLHVDESDLLRHLVKEQERSDRLRTVGGGGEGEGAPQTPAQATLKTPATTKTRPTRKTTSPLEPLGNTEGEEERERDEDDEDWEVEKKVKKKGAKKKNAEKKKVGKMSLLKQSKLNFLVAHHSAPITSGANQEPELESWLSPVAEEESKFGPDVSLDKTGSMFAGNSQAEDSVTVIEEIPSQKEHHRQTYRLLKRKNVIVEAVQSLKIIEGLFTIQRLVQDEEKLDGVNTKCCKKSILRLIRSLSKEGMLKLFRTTVIQDGVSKKVEFIVHPSVSPSDALVKSAIEQVRFRISSSYPAARNEMQEEEKAKERERGSVGNEVPAEPQNMRTEDKMGDKDKQLKNFKPSIVPGLSRSLGYQPKMPRLRLTHTFLWYLVYGHPLRHPSTPTPPDLHNTSSSIVLPTDNPSVQTTYPTTPSNPSQPQTTHPDDTHPSSSEHTDLPTSTPRNTDSPNPQNSNLPTSTPRNTDSPNPQNSNLPTSTPRNTDSPNPQNSNLPTSTPRNTDSPNPQNSNLPTSTPRNTDSPNPQNSDLPTSTPRNTDSPNPQNSDLPTSTPRNTDYPNPQNSDLPTSTPRNTDSPNPQNSDLLDTQSPPTDNAAVSDPASTEGQPGLTPDPEVMSSLAEEEQEVINLTDVGHDPDMKVYVDEVSWRRFIPPAPVHREFGPGWALTSDVVLCLPLSIYIQIIQISFKVDGLEEYLNDPVKQHYLIRFLPSRMKTQLLHKRKYIFSFHDSMQRLIFMGLLQFGPVEKFQDKDQVYLYVKRNCMIVDTTMCEPHYNLVLETRVFERRRYTLNTLTDVDNYWFDLMCVCLNTPLGVIRKERPKSSSASKSQEGPVGVPVDTDRHKFRHLDHMLKGSREVCYTAVIPGDGKGAGGLDSEFFGHLKRNWIWTCHLMRTKRSNNQYESSNTVRLNSLLTKHVTMDRGPKFPGPQSSKQGVPAGLRLEEVHISTEPSSRNRLVKGGKKQKRKRTIKLKKQAKTPQKKKKKVEVRKRPPVHDAADHKALMMMTRQRVTWSVSEDSVLILCRVASHFLNRKLRRPFVPWCVVRDLLHAEFEESLDKTSPSVGRRSRYILKNPQTHLNYKICLAEVYQDKPLIAKLQGRKHDPNDPKECSTVFREFVSLLRQKFSSASGSCDVTIPDTKTQLFSRFKVYTLEDMSEENTKDSLNSIEDIHSLVLNNLIQSTLAMSNSQMKCCRSFQTFHTYSRYRQEVLCQVFVQCRKKGLVNRRRISQLCGPNKNRALPILPMSYQLSQSYYRCFTWRLPTGLCTEVFDFMQALSENGTGDNHPSTVFIHEGKEKRESMERGEVGMERGEVGMERGEVGMERVGMERERGEERSEENMDKERGEEEREKEKDEDMETEDRGKNTENEQLEENEDNAAHNQVEEQVSYFTVRGVESTSGDPASCPLTQTEEPELGLDPSLPLDLTEMLQFSLESPGGATLACLSLMTLGLLSVHVSIPEHIVVLDSTMVDNEVVKSISVLAEDDDEEEENEGRRGIEVRAHKASHTKYLMMRGYCVPGIVNLRNLNTNDSIVVESCTMRLYLRHTPVHTLFITQDSPPIDFSRHGPSLLPSLLSHSLRAHPSSSSSPSSSPLPFSPSSSVEVCEGRLVTQRGYSPEDIGAVAELRATLERHGAFGLDRRDLVTSHTHLADPRDGRTRGLQRYIQDLLEEELLLEVGGSSVRLVLLSHAEPWLLTSTERQRDRPHQAQRGASAFGDRKHHNPLLRKRRMVAPREQEPRSKRGRRETLMEEEEEERKKMQPEEKDRNETSEERWLKRREEEEEEKEEERVHEEPSSTIETEQSTEGDGEKPFSSLAEEEDGEASSLREEEDGEASGLRKEEDGEASGLREEEDGEASGLREEEDGEASGLREEEDGEASSLREEEDGEASGLREEEDGEASGLREEEDGEASGLREEEDDSGGVCDVSFVSRPWRIVDGSLNRPVCKGMLDAVLYHVMTRPGLPEHVLLEHYRGVLQPVVVLDLVQALVELGCIKKRYVTRRPKPSLFSRPAAVLMVGEEREGETGVRLEETGVRPAETTTVFYEPTIDCCLRLGQVLPHENNWNQWVQFAQHENKQ